MTDYKETELQWLTHEISDDNFSYLEKEFDLKSLANCEDGKIICPRIRDCYYRYIDVILDIDTRSFPVQEFAESLLRKGDYLKTALEYFSMKWDMWSDERKTMPRAGGFIMDESNTHVLVIRSFGSDDYGLPAGKIEKGQTAETCAEKEMEEEIGQRFKVSKLAKMERKGRDFHTTLFFITGIPLETTFAPTERSEIEEIRWWR